jgi:uncharacterized membrane protein
MSANSPFTFRRRVLTGLAVLVPLGFTIIILRFLYRLMSGLLAPLVKLAAGPYLEPWMVGIVSLIILVILLYVVGSIAANLAGRRVIALGEQLVERIPGVKVIYSAAKQVVEAISLSSENVFTGVAFIEFGSPGARTLAFISGSPINDRDCIECYKLFVPTAPNPTTGFFQLMPCELVEKSTLTVEQGIKMIVSCGIVSPATLDFSGRP